MDLRSSPRVPVHCPIILAADHLLAEGSVTNLSVQGCTVTAREQPCRGDRVEVQVLLPDTGIPLRIDQAKVCWVSDGRCGLEFLVMPPESRSRLRVFLAEKDTRVP